MILVLFSNFEAKRAKNGSKNQKTYFVNVSQISILRPSKGLYFSFSKKSLIRCTLLYSSVQDCTVEEPMLRFFTSDEFRHQKKPEHGSSGSIHPIHHAHLRFVQYLLDMHKGYLKETLLLSLKLAPSTPSSPARYCTVAGLLSASH